ncbi:hypothetical protein ACP70R_028783 [Stipagrostis hirtigluma subsp. patula]
MAPPQGDHVVRFPDDTAAAMAGFEDGTTNDDADRNRCLSFVRRQYRRVFLWCALGAVVLAFVLVAALVVDPPDDYYVAVSGGGAAPLFNLTVGIRNPSMVTLACVKNEAAAAVYYGGAWVGGATVPAFCPEKRGEREVTVPVWGAAMDARRRGEVQSRGAEVDVVVRVPYVSVDRYGQYYDLRLACRGVKVGEDRSLCTTEEAEHYSF